MAKADEGRREKERGKKETSDEKKRPKVITSLSASYTVARVEFLESKRRRNYISL